MKNTGYILYLLLVCLFVSCKENTASVRLLAEAQKVIDKNPSEALVFLDSISDPENMDQDDYMQYIVARTGAKLKLKQSLAETNDTLIFEAQKYFDGTDKAEQAALANYYAGHVNREMKRPDKSLRSFLQSANYTKKTGDNKLFGRIYDHIAYTYFTQSLMDSAAVNYKRAIPYYKKENDTLSILRDVNQIGLCFESIDELDSAYSYFHRALNMAESMNNDGFKSKATQNLALTCYGLRQYEESIKYYQIVLRMPTINDVKRGKINLYLLKIYNETGDLSTAKEYAAKIEAEVSDVAALHTKKEMYEALSDHNKLKGDYKQALHFSELKNEVINQIDQEERPVEMIKADTDFRVEQHNYFYKELQSNIYLYFAFGASIITMVVVFLVLAARKNKKDNEEIQLQIEKYNSMRKHLNVLNSRYPQVEDEMKAMLEDDDENEKKDGSEKDPV